MIKTINTLVLKMYIFSQRISTLTYACLTLLLVTLMLMGCATKTVQENKETTPLENLIAEWNTLYESIDVTLDTSVDTEVWEIREQLEPHGMSVLRVNPNNLEHQRRYRRHLLGRENPSMEITDYQRHEKHSVHGSYGTECAWCHEEILDSIANRLNTFSQTQGS